MSGRRRASVRSTRGSRYLLLPIHPEHAIAILEGAKKWEFRTRRPSIDTGDVIVMYATSPLKAIVGSFIAGRIISDTPRTVWKAVHGQTASTRMSYFEMFGDLALPSRNTSDAALANRSLYATIRSRSRLAVPRCPAELRTSFSCCAHQAIAVMGLAGARTHGDLVWLLCARLADPRSCISEEGVALPPFRDEP
jgi:hypothetical protein